MDSYLVKQAITVFLWGLGAVLVVWLSLTIYGKWHDEWSGYNASIVVTDGVCNIAVVPIHGEILAYENEWGTMNDDSEMTSPEDVRYALNLAEGDPMIQGVLFKVDSTGGSPAGGEAIANMIQSVTLPTLALAGDFAVSAGYLIATGADAIIASPFSDVGSIGVTMSYLDYSSQNKEQGIEFISLVSGRFKDYGNPDKPMTAEERALFERDLKIYHDEFVKQVAANRSISEEIIAELADGSSMPASLAIEYGLINSIGNMETARAWFAEALQISPDDVIFCE